MRFGRGFAGYYRPTAASSDGDTASGAAYYGKPVGGFRAQRSFADRARGLSVRSANDARTGSSETAA